MFLGLVHKQIRALPTPIHELAMQIESCNMSIALIYLIKSLKYRHRLRASRTAGPIQLHILR